MSVKSHKLSTSEDLAVLISEMEDLKRENAQLAKEVNSLKRADDLTGLANQHRMYEFLSQEILRSNRYKSPLSVCFLDLDYFKQVNTDFGHQAGSMIIKKIAGLLKEEARKLDLVARFGGDEFVWVLPQTDLAGAYTAAERFRTKLSSTVQEIDTYEVQITASIGVSMHQNQETATSLLERADNMLRAAKVRGKNQTIFIEEDDLNIKESDDSLLMKNDNSNINIERKNYEARKTTKE